MRFVVVLSLCILLVMSGCASKEEVQETSSNGLFESEAYGFSFEYPSTWNEIRRDLPDQWAIVDGENTIIFTINDAQLQDLLALGKIQAIRDTQPEPGKVDDEIVRKVDEMVHLSTFGVHQWYTYAIEFSDKNVNSVVSGTVCENKEINMVLVSSMDTYEINRDTYIKLLNSFSCK